MKTFTARVRVIQWWFSVLALLTVAWLTFGSSPAIGTVSLAFGLSFVLPAAVLLLWPRGQLAMVRKVRGNRVPSRE